MARINKQVSIIIVLVVCLIIIIVIFLNVNKVKNIYVSNVNPMATLNNYEKQNSWLPSGKYPRGIRNNNIGNIIISNNNWRGKLPLTVNTDRKFEQFYRFENGVRALIKQVIAYKNAGCNTPYKFASRYVSGEGAINISVYSKVIANALKIEENSVITYTDTQIKSIVFAISKQENGKQYLDEYWYNLALSIL